MRRQDDTVRFLAHVEAKCQRVVELVEDDELATAELMLLALAKKMREARDQQLRSSQQPHALRAPLAGRWPPREDKE